MSDRIDRNNPRPAHGPSRRSLLGAAGEGAGGAFFDDYIGGGALTMCLVMGRIAGRGAAG
ncbi:MAG: hypothetical protein JJT95_18085 [Pararhodobacter sp.]|nr:hypothetical protein [Pararhodobacter sp.]